MFNYIWILLGLENIEYYIEIIANKDIAIIANIALEYLVPSTCVL